MIHIKDLKKRYPSQSKGVADSIALRGLSIDIQQGETIVVIGQNGSGKSTLLSLLSGQIDTYEGTLEVFDQPAPGFTRKYPVAYAAEQARFNPYWSVRQLFQFVGRIQNLSKETIFELIEDTCLQFQLEDLLDHTFDSLSKGMRQRVNLAQSLITQSNLIVWDEPTSGLDWIFTDLVEQQIFKLKEQGRTVIISSHDLHLARNICDRIVYLKYGQLKYAGTFIGWDQYLNLSRDPLEKRLVSQL